MKKVLVVISCTATVYFLPGLAGVMLVLIAAVGLIVFTAESRMPRGQPVLSRKEFEKAFNDPGVQENLARARRKLELMQDSKSSEIS